MTVTKYFLNYDIIKNMLKRDIVNVITAEKIQNTIYHTVLITQFN